MLIATIFSDVRYLCQGMSKIICPVCKEIGGSLTMRRAGNARNVKYFYIKHFNPSAKHKNTSCYIGLTYKLANVKLNDSLYRTFEKIVKSAFDYAETQRQNLEIEKAEGLLRSLGFPRRYLHLKLTADTNKAFLEKRV